MMVLLSSVVILNTMTNSLFDLLGLYHVTLTYSFYFLPIFASVLSQ